MLVEERLGGKGAALREGFVALWLDQAPDPSRARAVAMRNDAVALGLGEAPAMRDVERWGVPTGRASGTGV